LLTATTNLSITIKLTYGFICFHANLLLSAAFPPDLSTTHFVNHYSRTGVSTLRPAKPFHPAREAILSMMKK